MKLRHFFLLIIFTFTSITSIVSQNNSISFPVLSILKMDSTSFLTNKDLAENVNTVFINFSPSCDHCERTIKNILENIRKFRETQFVLTSFESFASIRKFYFDNGLNSFSTVFIGQEIDNSLTRQIKYSSFPCLVLFDMNKKHIKTIDKESNAKELLKALKIKSK